MTKVNNRMNNKQVYGNREILLMMIVAYIFSFAIRMIWVYQFQENPNFFWNGQLMINTNDGYTWAASAQNILYGMHESNSGIRDMWATKLYSLPYCL